MTKHGMQPFLEMTVDSDFGRGADSVRTYYGFNFDLKFLFQPAAAAAAGSGGSSGGSR
jgi:hypothetical protein